METMGKGSELLAAFKPLQQIRKAVKASGRLLHFTLHFSGCRPVQCEALPELSLSFLYIV